MIYLAGYTGRTPAQLLAAAKSLDAIVVDIRFSPHSRVIHWQQRGLQALLGRRYRWIKELGNPHYQGDVEMCLYNPDNGIPRLLDVEEVTGTIIVLCACAEQVRDGEVVCHRWLVAQELLGRGRESFELDWNLYLGARKPMRTSR